MSITSTHIQLKALPDLSTFQFISEGMAGPAIRQVSFVDQQHDNLFDLDINDLHSNRLLTTTISNTGSLPLSAVLILIIELYTDRYPGRTIRLKANSKEKAILYQITLGAHLDLLYPYFDIGVEEEDAPLPSWFRRRRNNSGPIILLLKRKSDLPSLIHTFHTTMNSCSVLFDKAVSVVMDRTLRVRTVPVETTE